MWKLPRLKESKPPRATPLPLYVMDELEALTVLVRGHGSEDAAPVVYITTGGSTGYRFRYYSDTISDTVRELWPELTEYQVHRAARWITAQVRNQLEERAAQSAYEGIQRMNNLRRRRNWATDYNPPGWED